MPDFAQIKLSQSTKDSIEWGMTPDLAFCTFSAKGLRKELTGATEHVCYFFIDNWSSKPRLFLMERGERHVNILAEISAPREMLYNCIVDQGGTRSSRNNFPIDSALKAWLIREVVKPDSSPYLRQPTTTDEAPAEDMGEPLPEPGAVTLPDHQVILPESNARLSDAQVRSIIIERNFFDTDHNPDGDFHNVLTSPVSQPVIRDEATNLMWQQYGLDLCSIRTMKKKIRELNTSNHEGHNDWRLPSLEEALSLMQNRPNSKGLHLPLCFSVEQPFIFVQATRQPTGYWFVDYKQGKVYWSSGTVPGGFARLCRPLKDE